MFSSVYKFEFILCQILDSLAILAMSKWVSLFVITPLSSFQFKSLDGKVKKDKENGFARYVWT